MATGAENKNIYINLWVEFKLTNEIISYTSSNQGYTRLK